VLARRLALSLSLSASLSAWPMSSSREQSAQANRKHARRKQATWPQTVCLCWLFASLANILGPQFVANFFISPAALEIRAPISLHSLDTQFGHTQMAIMEGPLSLSSTRLWVAATLLLVRARTHFQRALLSDSNETEALGGSLGRHSSTAAISLFVSLEAHKQHVVPIARARVLAASCAIRTRRRFAPLSAN